MTKVIRIARFGLACVLIVAVAAPLWLLGKLLPHDPPRDKGRPYDR